MTCERCQAENPAEAKFYSRCGHAFSPPPAAEQFHLKRMRSLVVALGGPFIVLATFFACYQEKPTNRSQPSNASGPGTVASAANPSWKFVQFIGGASLFTKGRATDSYDWVLTLGCIHVMGKTEVSVGVYSVDHTIAPGLRAILRAVRIRFDDGTPMLAAVVSEPAGRSFDFTPPDDVLRTMLASRKLAIQAASDSDKRTDEGAIALFDLRGLSAGLPKMPKPCRDAVAQAVASGGGSSSPLPDSNPKR